MSSNRFQRPSRWVVIAAAIAALLGGASAAPSYAATRHRQRPTVVLVHGAWADSSSWDGVVRRLQRDGYPVEDFPPPRCEASQATREHCATCCVRSPVRSYWSVTPTAVRSSRTRRRTTCRRSSTWTPSPLPRGSRCWPCRARGRRWSRPIPPPFSGSSLGTSPPTILHMISRAAERLRVIVCERPAAAQSTGPCGHATPCHRRCPLRAVGTAGLGDHPVLVRGRNVGQGHHSRGPAADGHDGCGARQLCVDRPPADALGAGDCHTADRAGGRRDQLTGPTARAGARREGLCPSSTACPRLAIVLYAATDGGCSR